MKRRICFIHRNFGESPSIERVFGVIGKEFEKEGIDVVHARLRYGNGLPGILANLLLFHPPKADIYHITGHIHYIALRLPKERTVLTVHDLGILRNRTGLRRLIIKKLYFDWPFKRLRTITAISEATKNDILKRTDCAPQKVTVIYDPLDPGMSRDATHNFNKRNPIVLQVGTAPHKNLATVIQAIKGLNCKLRVVGNMNNGVLALLRDAAIEFEVMHAGTDEQMKATYASSDIATFCSTFEGFGLPIIEAQAMGVPVVTSNMPPMNEVAGNGAVLVEPSNVEEIRSAIGKIISDSNFRQELVGHGRKNVERFEASKIAKAYLDLYEQVFAEVAR